MPLAWFATAPIEFSHVRAFSPGDYVPDSIVARFNLFAQGKVTQREVSFDPPGYNAALSPLLRGDVDSDEEREALVPSRLSEGALRAAFVRPKGVRTIPFGDSIDADVRGWYPYFTLGTKRIETVRNAGIGGQTTAQMLARVQTDVVAYAPDVVIIGGGTNDHGSGVPEATTRANIDSIVAAVRGAGATPILRTVPPADAAASVSPWNTVALRRQQILRHNAWLYGYAGARGIDVLDLHQAVVDPATGGYKAGITSDGIHPTEAGAKAIADYLLSLPLPASIGRGGFAFARAVTDPSNMLVNGVFTGDANADGIADSWNAGGSPVGTLTAAATGVTGNWQRLATPDATARYIMQDIATGYSTGDVVQIVGRIRSSGAARARVRLLPFGSATPSIDAVADMSQAIADGVFSARLTIPADLTKVRVMVQVGTAAGWVEVAEVALRNLTQLGVA